MKLWTVSLDYFGTGEGRTLFGWIGHAEDRAAALQRFGQAFDEYFAQGADAAEGVVEDAVIRRLFSPTVLADVRQLEGRGKVELTGRWHFNLG